MTDFSPGKLVHLRERDWVVLPSDDKDALVIKPLGGTDDEITELFLPLHQNGDGPQETVFSTPEPEDLGDISTSRLLYEAARLGFRNGAGPFRSLAKLSFRPRAYQLVPLILSLRQEPEPVRLLVADDVGVGKTIEALVVIRELLERRRIRRFAVLCPPHLCEQWQDELRDKLDIEAVIIRSSTLARLDREVDGDVPVYEHYPFQILSLDFIKDPARRDVFVNQGPELVIVDEVHTCACPAGATVGQQQRHELLTKVAGDKARHLILLTATPHSGKPEEFQSLLGLLKPDFLTLDIATASPAQRKELARHFVQRRRRDVEKWLGEDTVFPKRDPREAHFELSVRYAKCFDEVLDFARKLVSGVEGSRGERARYWAALGLLRGVMSSPAAGIEMLETRLEKLGPDEGGDEVNPVGDGEFSLDADNTPTATMAKPDWTDHQRRQLKALAVQLADLQNPRDDRKLAALRDVLFQFVADGFNPVVFCRYIPTARYLGEQLRALLHSRFPKLDLQVVTSEDPDEVRRERVEAMSATKQRVLIATDCLSEGINLQRLFTAVVHYDLPWNPNRLEQREGRVDRFGGAPNVKTCLIFGKDNPIDGIVLGVLLKKVREIRRDTGVTIAFPEDSETVFNTVAKALLLNDDRRVAIRASTEQIELGFDEFSEAKQAEIAVSKTLAALEAREKVTRDIFAHHAIQAHEIEADLREVDEAIGDPSAVETFVVCAVNDVFGAQMASEGESYRLQTTNLPDSLRAVLPAGASLRISFRSPTPEGCLYLGRNHPFVEQLCQIVMTATIERRKGRAARAAVIRCREVTTRTTLMLLRSRNVIEERAGAHRIVAEEALVWGWRGAPSDGQLLSFAEAKNLLQSARPTSDLSAERRTQELRTEIALLKPAMHPALVKAFDDLGEKRSQHLVEAHERFRQFLDRRQFQVVYPVLPMDVLGLYVLLPDNTKA